MGNMSILVVACGYICIGLGIIGNKEVYIPQLWWLWYNDINTMMMEVTVAHGGWR